MDDKESKTAAVKTLSPAEMRLAWWMCKGLNDIQIAQTLGIEAGTINTQKSEIFKNLSLTDYPPKQRRDALIAQYKDIIFALIPTEDTLNTYRPTPVAPIKETSSTSTTNPNPVGPTKEDVEKPSGSQDPTDQPAKNNPPSPKKPKRPGWVIPLILGGIVVGILCLGAIYGLARMNVITLNSPAVSEPTTDSSGVEIADAIATGISMTQTAAYTPPVPTPIDPSPTTHVIGLITDTPTDIPPTIGPTDTATVPPSTATPKPFYAEEEAVPLKPQVYMYLDTDFANTYCSSDEDWGVYIYVYNKSDSEYALRLNTQTFHASDDSGNTYQLAGVRTYGNGYLINEDVVKIINAGGYERLCVGFKGKFPITAHYIDIGADWISEIGPTVFRKNL
jgi:hypothetical protein